MMSRNTLLSIGVMIAGIGVPLQGVAYVPPEEVLNDESFNISQFFTPPPRARDADAVWRAQNSSAAARRQAEQEALFAEQRPQEEPETMHGAAPEESSPGPEWEALIKALENLSDKKEADTTAQTAEELRNQRILNRIEVQQAQAQYQAQLQALGLLGAGQAETLRSGAPLTDTGPATTLVVLAVAAAIGETMRRAKRAERNL